MFNKIMLIGNLGKDPELKVTAEGTPVTRFSLAVNRSYKTKVEKRKRKPNGSTLSHWRQLAEMRDDTCIKAQKSISKAA